MILLSEREEYVLAEIYRRDRGASAPLWASSRFDLTMGIRLTAGYLSNPLVDLRAVARSMGVPVRDLELALEDLVPMFRNLSAYGELITRANQVIDSDDSFRKARLLEEQPDLVEFFR